MIWIFFKPEVHYHVCSTPVQDIRRVQPTTCNVSQFLYFCKKLYMFQTVFPSIIRSSKLHIQRQIFVRPVLLSAASQYWTDKYLTLYLRFWAPDDVRKTRLKEVERLTEIKKLWNVASCIYSADILEMHGPVNVKPCTGLYPEPDKSSSGLHISFFFFNFEHYFFYFLLI